MTKKQELLDFIDENINDSNYLQTNVYYQDISEQGTRGFLLNNKEQLKGHFNQLFNDDLIGHSGDNFMIEILDWTTEIKEVV